MTSSPTSSSRSRGRDLAQRDGTLGLRVGIINIMPRAETYEVNLRNALAPTGRTVEPIWIRLTSHAYGSSDANHIARHYQTFEQVVRERPLDGLILTGAPVEELAFADVHYWTELTEILRHARRSIASTLGLCWGGLALAKQLDIEKVRFTKKLFGVFRNRVLAPAHPLLAQGQGNDDGNQDDGDDAGADAAVDAFWCAQSRHSGVSDQVLEAAADDGRIRLLAHAPETGYTIFESADRRYVMHLGHPEYDAARLAFECRRDRALGRPDVEAPRNFDADAPRSTWQTHCTALFSHWLASLTQGQQPATTV
jgi:homoserine O-succinyltransferase